MSHLTDTIQIAEILEEYKRESEKRIKPVLNQPILKDVVTNLNLASLVKKGGLHGDTLEKFLNSYLESTTRLHHPGYLSHQVAIPHPAGVQASLIDACTNNPMAIYEMGPAATAIEYFLINIFLEKIGWIPAPYDLNMFGKSPHGGGVLTNGGSLSILTALIAARTHKIQDVWENGNPSNLAVIVPAASHYSNKRSAGIIGIGHNSVYEAEADEYGVMIPDCLPGLFKKIEDEGKIIVSLTANACSTGLGLYDPLNEIGDICSQKNVWFHIDAAHGGSVLFSKKLKYLLNGVEKADSVCWDAHKLLKVPSLCAAILFKDHKNIDKAFTQDASYLFHEKNQPGFDFIHRTVECTKSALGLKLFMVLAESGENGITKYLDYIHDLTKEAYYYINNHDIFTCPVEPQSNILCFRLLKHGVDHLRLRDTININGNFYLSTTEYKEIRYLRIVIMNDITTMDDIKALVQEIEDIVAQE